MAETLEQRFASTEITSLALTDAFPALGDRLGTPSGGMAQFTALRNLLQANFTTLAASTSLAIAGNATLTAPSANVLELANSTNAQTLRVFNTRTDASNGEWGFMRWSSNVLEIGAANNGTGTARAVKVIYNGASRLEISSSVTCNVDFVGNPAAEIQGFRGLYNMNDVNIDLTPSAAGRWTLQQSDSTGTGADGDMVFFNRSVADAINTHILPHAGAVTDYITTSSSTTGGTGSAGAGNQYVELRVNGTVYKVLHDGTV